MTCVCRAASVLFLLGFCFACAEPTGPAPDARVMYDADPNQPDSMAPICPEDSLEIGGCQQLPGGGACTGSPEDTVFVSVPDNGSIPIVLGPQGLDMMVFSLRTGGIDPGDLDNPASTDRPKVSIFLYRADEEAMGRYTGRPSFLSVGSGDVTQEAVGVFLLIEDAVANGDAFHAVAEVSDQNGEYRCGNLEFLAEF